MDLEAAIGKVSTRGIKPGLQGILSLMEELGNPHEGLAVIHVTGTNGKGSVCAMLERCLREAGFRTGLYSSPHMMDYNERFLIDGKMIDDDTLLALLEEAGKAAKRVESDLGKLPTEFEVLTAMAFLWFVREKADVVVLEVGMGGRFDSTNIFPAPLATVITSISMDHEAYLGNDITKIAWEKAGIIKPGSALVTSCDNEEAYAVIKREFEEIQKAAGLDGLESGTPPLIRVWDQCRWDTDDRGLAGQTVGITTPYRSYEGLDLSLSGTYQCSNLADVVTVWDYLAKEGFRNEPGLDPGRLTEENLRKGLASVRWPCRLELVQDKPAVILDGSHNPDGIRKLADWLSAHRAQFDQVLLVMGMVEDKDRLSAVRHLDGLVSRVIITKPLSDRAGRWQGLAEGFEKVPAQSVEFVEDCHQAVKKAIGLAGERDLVLCTGSFYLVGELRRNWIEKGLFA
ncbi:MAG: bifunctional folylpolyglutamate synthase/dihydrofolate synthase [Clostridiales bacterium]|nr:bifunctional folylpolyglutamate synthase/dihydrofolate synthase [Clostridiales bacterium]